MRAEALQVQPEELARPRRRLTAVSVLVGAAVAGLAFLVVGGRPAVYYGFVLGAGPLNGYAAWRWPVWRRRGFNRLDRVGFLFVVVLNVLFGLSLLGDDDPVMAHAFFSLAFFSACLVPSGLRTYREHPPAAGWYPDPTGHFPLRRWEGVRWRDRVRTDDGTSLVDEAGAPATTVANAPRRTFGPSPAARRSVSR